MPSYSCSYASQLRSEVGQSGWQSSFRYSRHRNRQIEQEQAWRDHLNDTQPLFDTINQALGTGNLSSWNTWIDHAFDFLVRTASQPYGLDCS